MRKQLISSYIKRIICEATRVANTRVMLASLVRKFPQDFVFAIPAALALSADTIANAFADLAADVIADRRLFQHLLAHPAKI